uniref:Putative secreted protein n=1 Tax=Ixodes ricinus TaxID=34613 RepID=A0A6B0TQQ9_IXORI
MWPVLSVFFSTISWVHAQYPLFRFCSIEWNEVTLCYFSVLLSSVTFLVSPFFSMSRLVYVLSYSVSD